MFEFMRGVRRPVRQGGHKTTMACDAPPSRRPVASGAVLAAMAAAMTAPAGAQTRVDCSPAIYDFGTLSASVTSGSITCAPLVASGEPGYPTEYQGAFQFTLAEPAGFYAYLTGTFRYGFPGVSGYSGVGYTGSLFYGDQFLVSGAGSGIGGAERPALLNPSFANSPIIEGPQPAGHYTVQVVGRGFGDQPYGDLRLTIYDGVPNNPPVTPVPEPATMAAQALGLALLGGIWAVRRARERRR